jgi:membrane protein implicated in regulation of membrane protease activity
MMDYLANLGVWNWFILGGLLLVMEIIAPGTFMLWLGLSALIVGVLSLIVVWPWQAQLVAFAVLSIASIILWRRLSPKLQEVREQPFLNRRTEGFIGRVFTLDKPIVDGSGTVRIDDTIWQVRGPDSASGARVKVTDADGATLHVMPADDFK